ncbi:hypothetical protein [Salipiger marinus]|uniref:Uncharacterized protein n=1 Tax=Salipiger marinus TaxID=555512 RepID=A0A1G8RH04_9RHOB|nr:hypothetical protein [Salipiger marinus]SDJ16189.1 hypothetical protein SAMN04487993_102022 [Salipiger marinus]
MGDRKGTSRGWHITRAEGTLTLSRRLPARFDLGVGTILPQVARPERLAHQVRQDLWRALRDLRGFAPCVRITPQDGQLHLLAGGEVAGAVPRAQAEARIAAVLEDGARRARWLRWAA